MGKGPFKMKGYSYPGTSPLSKVTHGAGTEWQHTHSEKVAHSDGAAAHNKKTQKREEEATKRFHGAGGTVVDDAGNIIESLL